MWTFPVSVNVFNSPCHGLIGSALYQWNTEGIRPNHSSDQVIQLVQPSLDDLQATLKGFDDLIEQYQNARFWKIKAELESADYVVPPDEDWYKRQVDRIQSVEEDIRKVQSFHQQRFTLLGSVWASSGLRQSDHKRTLDWAILKIAPERLSINIVSAGWVQMSSSAWCL